MLVALIAAFFLDWLVVVDPRFCHALSLAKKKSHHRHQSPRFAVGNDNGNDPNTYSYTSIAMTETTAAATAVPNELPRQIHYSPFLNAQAKTTTDDAVPPPHLDPSTTAMIILNAPIRQPPSALFDQLWNKSSLHICADGGANRLYQATAVVAAAATNNNNNQQQDKYRPDLITGDLDSLWPETRAHYSARGVDIVRQYDQNFNDLDKSIRSIASHGPQYTTCFVYGAFGGRFDQEMASMQALFTHGCSSSDSTLQQIWLWSDQNAALLLQPHVQHEIYCPNYGDDDDNEDDDDKEKISKKRLVLGEGPTCGLIPLGEPCQSVTTRGLKWNLDGSTPLAFGGLVSTSNCIVAPVVQVTCSHPLVFTVEVHANMKDDKDDAPW